MIPHLRNSEDAVHYGLSLYPVDIEQLSGQVESRRRMLELIRPHIGAEEALAKACAIQFLDEALQVATGEGEHLIALARLFRASGNTGPQGVCG